MSQRICSVDGCERKHQARGLCDPHYNREYHTKTGKTHHKMVERTCIVCDSKWMTSRANAKFCTDTCKGQWYSDTRRTKCRLPAHHPVMTLIAEAKKPKPKPAKVDKRTPRECPGCACWFSPVHPSAGHMLYCTDRCARKTQARRRRSREHGALGAWVWSDFMRIARKFNYCCAYCGVKPDRLDPDHVVPLSRGGYDSPGNLLPTCMLCNSSKCAMTLSEWAAWRAQRGQSPRATNWAPEDKRYWHLTQAVLDISPAA